MLPVTVINTIMYASILILLCVGFSFTHMMEGFPNFSHTSYASIGTMFTYILVRLLGQNPYTAWPLAAILNGLVAVAIYLIIVAPMKRGGANGIHITFAMFALNYLIASLMAVFSFWVMKRYPFNTSGFLLRAYDFRFVGYPGILFTAPLICVILVFGLHLFLTRVKFGIAIRATAEDPKLSAGLGVNTFLVHLVTWFLVGAMAGVAGAALPLWQASGFGGDDELMMNVIAGSVLGGLDNIYGAILGGVFLAFTQRVLPSLLVNILGIWFAGYQSLTPIVVVVGVLTLEPRGLPGFAARIRKWLNSRKTRSHSA
ncbi:MAG: branched-chain amino acid ABC transporter permease [Candidatus Bathyarchaeota archaeon]|jgi:branched-chain amino acid transport system permease protein